MQRAAIRIGISGWRYFVYLRFHGDKKLYVSGYSNAALARWGERIRCWREGREPADARLIDPSVRPERIARDVYCYFDNDAKVKAPHDAQRLAASRMLARRYRRTQMSPRRRSHHRLATACRNKRARQPPAALRRPSR
jgi:uncharacterized protein YecE (DUF72 family)